MRADEAYRNQPDSKAPDPLLRLGVGARMACVREIGGLLGVERLWENVELPQTVVGIAQREKLRQLSGHDGVWLARLKRLASELGIKRLAPLTDLLRDLAPALGMQLSVKHEQPTQSDGTRPRIPKEMHLSRLVPDLADDLPEAHKYEFLDVVGEEALCYEVRASTRQKPSPATRA